MKTIVQIQKSVSVCKEHKPVHDKYVKIGWKKVQEVFANKHKEALDAYNQSFRYLKKQGLDLDVDLTALQTEYDTLPAVLSKKKTELSAVKEELQPLKDVRYWIGKVLEPEQTEGLKKPEPKHSLTEKMKYLQEQKKQPATERKPHRKQNMEL